MAGNHHYDLVVNHSEQALQPLQFLLAEDPGPDSQRRRHLLYQVVDPVVALPFVIYPEES